jgi:hypothetical protein
MCLLTSRKNGWIAVKDIICYKVLCKKNEEYYTPYVYKKLSPGEILGTRSFYDPETNADTRPFRNVFSDKNSERFLTGLGFIHTYKGLKSAKDLCHDLSLRHSYNYVVFKCIIPVGTRYYKGRDEYSGAHAYAAEEIKFVEKVYELKHEKAI